jgi:uncharacterized SAM-binding protein YcdF (DUF218 family)
VRIGVLVLGYHRDDGGPGLSDLALAAVRHAERIAAREQADVVVCSGFARGDGPSEGELMRDAWAGAPIEVVAEPTARDTVENATCSLPLLAERGVERVLVVCAVSHALRVRLLLPRYFARHGLEARVRPFWRPFAPRRLAWEVRGLRWLPEFRRRLDSA